MFGGFKARLNLLGGKRNKKNDQSELSPDMFVTGAYRVNREDLYGYRTQDPVKSPERKLSAPLRPVKSTSNLVQPKTANQNLRNSTPSISRDPRGAEQSDRISALSSKELKNQKKEQKKLEKQRLIEQKKQAQEQAKQEKLLKERARKKTQKEPERNNVKAQAPTPQPQTSNPVVQQPAYSTNTLESSISRSSGPPPYSKVPNLEQVGNRNKTGNVVYSKPIDTGSWDIISQHREQINRPAPPTVSADGKRKQMVMDLNYNFGTTNNITENSDA